MRKSGGEPVVMCMSLAPFSIMARSSWCRLTLTPSGGLVASIELSDPWCFSKTVRFRRACRSVRHGDARDFLGRGDAVEDLLDAAHAQGGHTVLDGGGLELGGGRTLQHELA